MLLGIENTLSKCKDPEDVRHQFSCSGWSKESIAFLHEAVAFYNEGVKKEAIEETIRKKRREGVNGALQRACCAVSGTAGKKDRNTDSAKEHERENGNEKDRKKDNGSCILRHACSRLCRYGACGGTGLGR